MSNTLRLASGGAALLALCVALIQNAAAFADTPTAPTNPGPAQANTVMQEIAPGRFLLGKCILDKKARSVEFPATINMTNGTLEYALVGQTGKTHESLLRTAVKPTHLQIAMLLLDFKPTDRPLPYQGANELPDGTPVSIRVRPKDSGTFPSVPLEAWIRKGETAAGAMPWIFTGSVVTNGSFLAEQDRSFIALYHDPAALIDHQLQDGASDELWFPNSTAMPQLGAEIIVTIEHK